MLFFSFFLFLFLLLSGEEKKIGFKSKFGIIPRSFFLLPMSKTLGICFLSRLNVEGFFFPLLSPGVFLFYLRAVELQAARWR